MFDIKIPDPPTSPSLISLNGFCGRKAPFFLTKKRRDAAFDWSKFYFVVPVNSEENPALKTWLKFTVLARTNLGP